VAGSRPRKRSLERNLSSPSNLRAREGDRSSERIPELRPPRFRASPGRAADNPKIARSPELRRLTPESPSLVTATRNGAERIPGSLLLNLGDSVVGLSSALRPGRTPETRHQLRLATEKLKLGPIKGHVQARIPEVLLSSLGADVLLLRAPSGHAKERILESHQ
jgi:hypothetical protein